MRTRVIELGGDRYRFRWAEIFLVIAVFTKEIGSRNVFGIDFDFIGYPFFILYFAMFFIRIVTAKSITWMFFGYLTISSLVSVIILNLPLDGFLKQIIPIIIITSVTVYILSRSDINAVFLLYVRINFWTAIFGILQVILSYFGINILIKIPGRLDSIAYEPSHYSAILLPALVYTYLNFKRFKLYFFTMLAALLLTYNLTAYLVFLGILTFSTFNPLYVLISIPVAYYVFFNVLPHLSQNFALRFNDTFSTLRGQKSALASGLNVNGTTLSFYSNYEVAKDVLSKSPLTGAGLGGHEEMYYRHFKNTSFFYNVFYGVNAKSAHSLSIRIISELGLVGAGLYVYFLIKNFIFSNKTVHYAISMGCVSHFLSKSFKLGGYIDYGTPFFFAVLIFNARSYRQSIAKPKNVKKNHRPVSLHPAS